MKWSTRIGTFAGISVYVHTTFLMLIAWVAVAHWQTGHSVGAVVKGVGFIVALFGCVVLHEFGHVRQQFRYGVLPTVIVDDCHAAIDPPLAMRRPTGPRLSSRLSVPPRRSPRSARRRRRGHRSLTH